MAIQSFEEIQAWQAARELTRLVYETAGQGPFAHDRGLRDQVQRAAVSAMANIAEGFDSTTGNAFIQFLGYALRSTTEVQSHLYVALDQQYITPEQFNSLYDQAVTVKKLIHGFLRYLRQAQHPPAPTTHKNQLLRTPNLEYSTANLAFRSLYLEHRTSNIALGT